MRLVRRLGGASGVSAAMLGVTGLLACFAWAATIRLGPRLGPGFWPSAVLGIACAVLATAQFIRRPGRHATH